MIKRSDNSVIKETAVKLGYIPAEHSGFRRMQASFARKGTCVGFRTVINVLTETQCFAIPDCLSS